MAGRAVSEILSPLVIVDRISRIDFPGTALSSIFGWNVTNFFGANPQGNTMDHGLRTGRYDIFDVTRKVATARVPGAASSNQKPQFVGSVDFTIPRSAETIMLKDEHLDNQRQIGGPASSVDRGGVRYIDAQLEYVGQRYANLIEFQTAGMLRGGWFFRQNGDDLEQSFTTGSVQIDYQIPAGNLDQLNMVGAGDIIDASWLVSTTNIPDHLNKINQAFLELTGQPLRHVCIRGDIWEAVKNNDFVIQQAGSAQTPFVNVIRETPGEQVATLRGFPYYIFHVIDYGLEIWDGSSFVFEHLIEDDHGMFFPEPEPRWVEYIRGGETVTEGPNGTRAFRFGYYNWAYPSHDPSGWNLSSVFNGLPALLRPKAIAYGDLTP